MYAWRKMTDSQREEVFRQRVRRGGSWRRPPVWTSHGQVDRFLITASCFEHADHIAHSTDRLSGFEESLLQTLEPHCADIFAHVILPNHYHALVSCEDIRALRSALGKLHGRSSRTWNQEEKTSGRKVFHGSAETRQKSERHFFASMNYIHHNPVRHGYVRRWQDWPWSSAKGYLQAVGLEAAKQFWQDYPIDRYGDGWD